MYPPLSRSVNACASNLIGLLFGMSPRIRVCQDPDPLQVFGICHTIRMMIPIHIWHFLETLKILAQLSQSHFQLSCSSKDFPSDLLLQPVETPRPKEYLFVPALTILIFASGGLYCICCLRARSFFHNNPLFGGNLFLCFSRLFHSLHEVS